MKVRQYFERAGALHVEFENGTYCPLSALDPGSNWSPDSKFLPSVPASRWKRFFFYRRRWTREEFKTYLAHTRGPESIILRAVGHLNTRT